METFSQIISELYKSMAVMGSLMIITICIFVQTFFKEEVKEVKDHFREYLASQAKLRKSSIRRG